ncbi:MAG TPA: glycosyltransferase family 39 protein [Thermoanaerobaculia bacterium]|nr:glycosyltransferase family 39 protein [Thermoanaerobaculia bacterium]
MAKRERILLLTAGAAALILRAVAYFRYRFDSDEQQHLHVVWGWTAGLVQYRDIFDNHTPLFHMLMAPLLAAFGERADILLWMRLPMLALFAVVLWATFDLGRRLYNAQVAARAVVLLALFPPFFLKSLEFRNDNLWTVCSMLAVLALVRGWRPLIAGILLGCAFAVSTKTLLLLAALAGAAMLTRRPLRLRWIAEAVAGAAIVPIALAIWFAQAGAWDELVYCNFVFNGRLALIRKSLWIGRALFPFMLGAVVWLAWKYRPAQFTWRWFFGVASGVFTATLLGFWVLISPRDFLALMPILAIFAAAALPFRGVAVAVALSMASLWYYADGFENHTDWHITMMDQALRLSRPGEMLMDIKGETIYRRRPFYYALEIVTRTQLAHGMLEDTIAEDVVRTRTYVAQADGPLWPPQGRAFLSENFLNMGRLRAAGQMVKDDGTFSIAIPGEYVIVGANGEVRGGVLDGTPYSGARVLGAGPHRFDGAKGVAVLWAPAFRRGHSPFHLRDLEF